jgi:hypothetical protein
MTKDACINSEPHAARRNNMIFRGKLLWKPEGNVAARANNTGL